MTSFGCQTTAIAGHCLGIPKTNAVLATLLLGAAIVLFDQWVLQLRENE